MKNAPFLKYFKELQNAPFFKELKQLFQVNVLKNVD